MMLNTFPPADDDLTYISFKDVSWLQSFGLDVNNVMDYFSLSQFFDRSCNNQVVRMQLQFTDNGSQCTTANILSKLKTMTGIEYEIFKAVPPRLFIIHKQNRTSFTSTQLLSIISHRILSSMSYLQSSIEYAGKWLEFDPTKSRYNIIKQVKTKTTENEDENMEKTEEEEKEEEEIVQHRDKVDFITQINTNFMNFPNKQQ